MCNRNPIREPSEYMFSLKILHNFILYKKKFTNYFHNSEQINSRFKDASLLDNTPNYLVGCIIQKRYLHFRDAEVLVTSMFGLLETVVKMTIVIAMAMPLQCGQFQSILLSIRVKMHITTKVVPQL